MADRYNHPWWPRNNCKDPNDNMLIHMHASTSLQQFLGHTICNFMPFFQPSFKTTPFNTLVAFD